MCIVFLMDSDQCVKFFHPLPDMGYMAGIGIFCAVSIKKITVIKISANKTWHKPLSCRGFSLFRCRGPPFMMGF